MRLGYAAAGVAVHARPFLTSSALHIMGVYSTLLDSDAHSVEF